MITEEMRRDALDKLWRCFEAARELAEGPTDDRWSALYQAIADVPDNPVARAALTAALSPQQAGVEVRIAVAFDPFEGGWRALGRSDAAGDADLFDWLSNSGHTHHAAIITARIQPPAVPVVVGMVSR